MMQCDQSVTTSDLLQYSKARFKKNELSIDDGITIDEWKELGQSLKQVEGSVQFWIGDWARFGDKKGFTGKYTDSKVYDELEEITGLDRRTIQDYKTVADRVPSAGRHADLSFSQHREVASLPVEKQTMFLDKASEEKLSVRKLRQAISADAFEDAAVTVGESLVQIARAAKRRKTDEDIRRISDLQHELNLKKDLISLAREVRSKYSKSAIQLFISLLQPFQKIDSDADRN